MTFLISRILQHFIAGGWPTPALKILNTVFTQYRAYTIQTYNLRI